MRRALWGMTVIVVALVSVAAARPRPAPCDPGRYLVDAGRVLVPGATPPAIDVLTVGETIAIASGCPAVASNARVTRRGTRIDLTFPSCAGLAGRARLKARIDRPCRTMRGVFRARADRLRTKFRATRSTCGDGIFDPDAGETCDAGLGCGGSSCVDCICAGGTTTTTSTTSTTLSAGPCDAPTVPPLRVIPVNAAALSFAPFATQPPGSSDWYVVEQRGRIRDRSERGGAGDRVPRRPAADGDEPRRARPAERRLPSELRAERPLLHHGHAGRLGERQRMPRRTPTRSSNGCATRRIPTWRSRPRCATSSCCGPRTPTTTAGRSCSDPTATCTSAPATAAAAARATSPAPCRIRASSSARSCVSTSTARRRSPHPATRSRTTRGSTTMGSGIPSG